MMGGVDPSSFEALDDRGDGPGGFFVVDRHPDQLAASFDEPCDLIHRCAHVGGVGVGHRLDGDGV